MAYNENDHPRDSDGKFSTAEGAALGRSRSNPLTRTSSGRSQFGSGASVETFSDTAGNEYISIGGREPTMSKSAEAISRTDKMRDIGARARVAADAEDWDAYDSIMAEVKSL